MKISICVATYGDQSWADLALERAVPSTAGQGAHEVLSVHEPEGTVSSARNRCASQATGDFLVFLDADDELAPYYVEEMTRAAQFQHADVDLTMTLFTPAVAYVVNGTRNRPKFWPEVPYQDANWMVVGTMISRTLFEYVGGFGDWGDPPGSNAYEDWALWALCQREGAGVVRVPEAVYIAHQEPTSRHRNHDHATRLSWHHEIGRALFPERYPERLEDWGPGRSTVRNARARERRRG